MKTLGIPGFGCYIINIFFCFSFFFWMMVKHLWPIYIGVTLNCLNPLACKNEKQRHVVHVDWIWMRIGLRIGLKCRKLGPLTNT